jgi:hypothetical protein
MRNSSNHYLAFYNVIVERNKELVQAEYISLSECSDGRNYTSNLSKAPSHHN